MLARARQSPCCNRGFGGVPADQSVAGVITPFASAQPERPVQNACVAVRAHALVVIEKGQRRQRFRRHPSPMSSFAKRSAAETKSPDERPPNQTARCSTPRSSHFWISARIVFSSPRSAYGR